MILYDRFGHLILNYAACRRNGRIKTKVIIDISKEEGYHNYNINKSDGAWRRAGSRAGRRH
ncbi:MAG: hypothetical protein DBY09_06125 [Selenomonadales bacterium]|nr:MAG: hypothetical protein DBY09_06125 [Selenomonadales bacterium]